MDNRARNEPSRTILSTIIIWPMPIKPKARDIVFMFFFLWLSKILFPKFSVILAVILNVVRVPVRRSTLNAWHYTAVYTTCRRCGTVSTMWDDWSDNVTEADSAARFPIARDRWPKRSKRYRSETIRARDHTEFHRHCS